MYKKILIILSFVFWALPSLEILSEAEAIAQSVDTAWVRHYNQGRFDEGVAIAVDGSGNVYVTGSSFGEDSGEVDDYLTIKYYPHEGTAWARLYNGPGNWGDRACAIAVDSFGNVYVTGSSHGIGNSDYATIKYYPNGDTAWVRRYDGSGNANDGANGIAVDDSGNVYVTGCVYITSNDGDYATIKYDSSGNQLWVRTYDGTGNYSDYAQAIAVDSWGNVYVTGTTSDTQSAYPYSSANYTTIKYDTYGNLIWVGIYNGPAGGAEVACAIALDASGNAYVTGKSHRDPGSFRNYDYATVKYYSNGLMAWVRRYSGPADTTDQAHDIAVDDSGNVYVTGESWGGGTGYDYATIKYYSNGDVAWVSRYNGPGDYDKAYDVAVDGSGSVYVTGESNADFATIKYYPNGDTAWVQKYSRSHYPSLDRSLALAVDGSNNVYLTGMSQEASPYSSDCTTIKYVQFLRGDVTGNGVIDIGDVVHLITYLYKSGPAPDPLAAGDVNCNGVVDLGDVVYLITYLYKSGPPLPC